MRKGIVLFLCVLVVLVAGCAEEETKEVKTISTTPTKTPTPSTTQTTPTPMTKSKPVLHIGDMVNFNGIKFTFVDVELIYYSKEKYMIDKDEYYLRFIYKIENTLDEKIPYYADTACYANIDGQQVTSVELIDGDKNSDIEDFIGTEILPHAEIYDSIYVPLPSSSFQKATLYVDPTEWGYNLFDLLNKTAGKPVPKTAWDNSYEIILEVEKAK